RKASEEKKKDGEKIDELTKKNEELEKRVSKMTTLLAQERNRANADRKREFDDRKIDQESSIPQHHADIWSISGDI
ncbi:hypothetical protein PMAYCL1PPCAC_00813, partial [Pristionchus mayeri]